ncbi:MAG: aldehyde ferredoxin oxidoreductase family protein [Desulfovibrio sp.]
MAEQLFGWTGKYLRVDLSSGASEVRALPEETRLAFLGGRGLGGFFLRDFASLPCEHPDLPLIIASGPLTGTDAPASSRCHIVSRSPLTGAVGDASVGGRLGLELKHAGYDALVLVGRANALCGLEIDDAQVRLVDATALSGLPTPDVFTRLRAHRPSGSIAATGPAAENGCRFASILADTYHMAARCGLGLIAGHKRLKYIAVRGGGATTVADPAALACAREDILRLANASPALMGQYGFARQGTRSLFDLMDARRMMPTDNFSRTHFAAAGGLNAYAFAQRHHPVRRGCPGCPVACKALSGDGRPLPEYEAQSHFTALIGNPVMELAMRANDFCACLGLDPVSAASALACHRERTGADYTPDQVLALLLGMATGTGPEAALGAELAQGATRYAAAHQRPELAMSVKGLDLPPFDPRGAYGLALGYAVSTQGGSHLRANPISHEVLRKPVATDRFSFSGKARIIKGAEDMHAAADSLTICRHLLLAAGLEEYAKAYSAVTGQSATAGDLLKAGERICYQERLLNAQNGFSAADDDLPARFFAEPGSGAPDLPVPPIPREDFLRARSAYYRIRCLDENGLPLRDAAARLGLPWPQSLDGKESA